MKKKSVLREWVEAIIIAASLAIFLRTFFFQVYKIPTNSMNPTLKPGDKIFVIKFTYGPKIPFTHLRLPRLAKLRRGDVIVFVPPLEKNKPWFKRKQYVKRLIGLENDRILIKDGNVYINDKRVVDPRIAKNYYYNQGEYGREEEIVVPEGKYFFLGDNSISSFDSRYWGFVDEEDILGRAIFIWWPPKRIGIIE
jgi:signal peptidase I